MTKIAWRRQMSVGQPTIDEDHKHLIGYLNDLGDALEAQKFPPVRVAKVLAALLEYTHDHFAREERMMVQAHYPDYDAHVLKHREAVRVIAGLANSFSKEPTRVNAERLYNFTAEWLVRHIIMEDSRLAPYVRGLWI